MGDREAPSVAGAQSAVALGVGPQRHEIKLALPPPIRRSSVLSVIRKVSILLALALAAGCIATTLPAPSSVAAPQTLRVRVAGKVVAVPFEEYVLGSALSEVSPVDESPATIGRVFEVQAILARTYALSHLGKHRTEGFDLCDGTHCQIYQPGRIRTSRFTEAARIAVARTAAITLFYSGRPAEALYHADCGGHTATAAAVWGGKPVAYLTGSPDEVPPDIHRTWRIEVPLTQLRAALNKTSRSAVGKRLDRIAVVDRDGSGRAAKLEVRGEKTQALTGEVLRSVLNQTLGDRAIMSTRFSVTKTKTGYEFVGRGFGHGVGLCQVGALARARRAEPTALILAAYFPGTSLGLVGGRTTRNPLGPGGPLLLKSP